MALKLFYYFFMTSFTKLFFSAEELRNFRISSFCCGVSAMCSPLSVVHIKDFEEFFLNDIAVFCLFDELVFQAEFDDFILLVVFIHLSFHLFTIRVYVIFYHVICCH